MAVSQTLMRPIDLIEVAPREDAVRVAQLALASAIPFHSLCEEHLLPFYGIVHIGYVRDEEPLNPAELTRIVEACSGGIQVQQKMTARIGLWVYHQLALRGVGVLVEGGYGCTPVREGAALAGPTTTMAFYGPLRHSAQQQREFLTRTRKAAKPDMVVTCDHD
jgi:GTP cyclohydrolase I